MGHPATVLQTLILQSELQGLTPTSDMFALWSTHSALEIILVVGVYGDDHNLSRGVNVLLPDIDTNAFLRRGVSLPHSSRFTACVFYHLKLRCHKVF